MVVKKENIDRLLVLQHKNQKELAKAIGIEEKTFSARKKTGKFSTDEIGKMAGFFGVSFNDLINDNSNTESDQSEVSKLIEANLTHARNYERLITMLEKEFSYKKEKEPAATPEPGSEGAVKIGNNKAHSK